ncbi:MAG: T9SS type A sorting domain-containing protein [Bacteroidota bacterium]
MLRTLVLLSALGFLVVSASAQTCTTSWINASDGDWSDDANWSDGAPEAGDTACITEPGTYIVSLDRDQGLAGLVLGGASGTQTLVLDRSLTSLTEGTVGPNGVLQLENCGTRCGGLFRVENTLSVEGTLVHRSSSELLSDGGTVDVASGGTLRVRTGISSVNIGSGTEGSRSRVIVGGTLLFDTEGQLPRSTTFRGDLDLAGGTVAITAGSASFQAQGRWAGGTFEVPEGAELFFRAGNGSSGVFEVTGTLSGSPAGEVEFDGSATLAAGADGATLDVQGAGIKLEPGSGFATFFTSAGGAFTNTGRISVEGRHTIRGVTLRNEGVIAVESILTLDEGAEIENRSSGLIEITSGSVLDGVDGEVIRGSGRIAARGSSGSTLGVPLDLDGATLEVSAPSLLVGEGTLRDVTFDIAEGSFANLTSSNTGLSGVFEVGGTLSGDIEGTLFLGSSGTFAAASGGVILALGGTGLTVSPGSGRSAAFTSAGGELRNTGLVRVEGNGLTVRQAVFVNEGTVRATRFTTINEGAVVRNAASGVVDFGSTFSVSTGARTADGTGRLVNEGLFLVTGSGVTSFGGTLRSQAGSEIRPTLGANVQLEAPGSAALPDGARLTGNGRANLRSRELFLEGTISPGTDAQPLDTLRTSNWLRFSPVAGNPQLVVDVGSGGASDLVEHTRGSGPAGSVQLAGALIVRVAEGYTPQIGDTFTVLRTTNTSGDIQGDFAQVFAVGAPDGIAFVSERNADNSAVLVRAVEAASGGAIVVSETDPVGGGIRRLILSGPGARGVGSARLECTDCLDAEAFGTIAGDLSVAGGLTELRFDLTSPRAYGFYDLVLTQPGLDDARVPLTVRPLITAVNVDVDRDNGMRMWPANGPGQIHNFSWYDFYVRTNDIRGAAPFLLFERPVPDRTSMILASTHDPRRTASARIYNSLIADDPFEPALAFARLPPISNEAFETGIEVGLRIDPDAVLFPDEMPTGPDDDRIPFGEGQVLTISSQNNISIERAERLMEIAIRAASDASLSAYLSALDLADPEALGEAVRFALGSGAARYVQGVRPLLDRFVEEASATVQAPADLASGAEDAFNAALRTAAEDFTTDISASLLDGFAGSAAVAALLQAEFDALEIEPDLTSDGRSLVSDNDEPLPPAGQQCKNGNYYQLARGGKWFKCPPPSGPADPNDKVASNEDLSCEYEAATVDGVETFRCARAYLPISRAGDPIEYTIRFENLPEATAPATLVTITDLLDSRFDPSTLEVVSTSSDSTFSFSVQGQEVTFRFVGIDLPPNVTSPEGEGYVTFRVAPHSPLVAGDVIENDASIVFDFNPAIETGTVIHEAREVSDLGTFIIAPDIVQEGQPFVFEVSAFNIVGDPASGATVTVSTGGASIASAQAPAGSCTVGTEVVCQFDTLSEEQAELITIMLDDPPRGIYALSSSITYAGFDGFEANNLDLVSSGVVGVSVEDDNGFPREVRLASIAPNPVQSAAVLRWGVPQATAVDLRIYDLRGREVAVLAEGEAVQAGWHETTWRPDLANGVYLVRLMVGAEVRTKKLLVVR